MNVLLFGCLSGFWLKIRLVDALVGLFWHHNVVAMCSQRQDVVQGTWLLLSHGAAISEAHLLAQG